jgi:16S rRNA (uracil1498-N3)-methyltransferase
MNYFYQPEIRNGVLELNPDESNHCIRVLRIKPDDLIQVLDGKGGWFVCKVTEANPVRTRFEIVEEKQGHKKDHSIHIAIAPPKNLDRLEWFVEKSVEIGIDRISYLICNRSERKHLKLDRLGKKAIGALKQSGNLYLPEMSDMIPFESFIGIPSGTIQKYIAYADHENAQSLIQTATPKGNYLVLIGPEGDFSPDELQASREGGFLPVSLGPSRLRTETAGLVACMMLNFLQIHG